MKTKDINPKHYLRKNVYTMGDVSRACNVSARTASKWFDQGKLKGYRIPGSLDRRVPHADLVRFMKANKLPLKWIGEDDYRVLFVGMSDAAIAMQHTLLADVTNVKFDNVSSTMRAAVHQIQFSPDLVVIDFHLGRTSAIELATQLLAQHSLGSPLILVGLCLDDECQVDSLKADLFTEIFQLPCDPNTLAEFIKTHATPPKDDEIPTPTKCMRNKQHREGVSK